MMGRAMERGIEEREESADSVQLGIRPVFVAIMSPQKIFLVRTKCRGYLLPNYWLKKPLNSILLLIVQNFHKLVIDAHLLVLLLNFLIVIFKPRIWRIPQSDLPVRRSLWDVSIIFLPWAFILRGGIYLFVSKYNLFFPLCLPSDFDEYFLFV